MAEQLRAEGIAALVVGEQRLVQDLATLRGTIAKELLSARAEGVASKTVAHEILIATSGEATAENLARIDASLRQRASAAAKQAARCDPGSQRARGPGERAAASCGAKGRLPMYRRRTVEEWFESAPSACERAAPKPDEQEPIYPEVDLPPELAGNEEE